MSQILDCMVNYFGLDESQEPDLRRYYCYHILGGPGPVEESGVATLTTLAVHDESERCTYCQTFYMVETGGPTAAIAEVIRYLDDVHRGKHLRKVQTEIRGLQGDLSTDASQSPETRFRASQGRGVPTQKG